MTIRWKKIAPILAVITLVGLLPYINELFHPGYMSGIACVRPYPEDVWRRTGAIVAMTRRCLKQ